MGPRSRTTRARGAAAVALVAIAGLLAACGPGDPATSTAETKPTSPGAAVSSPAPSATTAHPGEVTATGPATPGASPTGSDLPDDWYYGPSGMRMPTGDLPKWTQVFADDFKGSELGGTWVKYSGQPGGDPAGWWDPSHVKVRNGMLSLQTKKTKGAHPWVSGGIGSWNGLEMKYGKVDVRFRVPKGHGLAYAFLLWPSSSKWPPEIDFAEDGGGDRTSTSATLHYTTHNLQLARSVNADFTQWHTVGVEWTPRKLVYTLDGKPWATISSKQVPNEKMVLALQTQVWGCHIKGYTCPNATTPKSSSLDVDWVVAYERATD